MYLQFFPVVHNACLFTKIPVLDPQYDCKYKYSYGVSLIIHIQLYCYNWHWAWCQYETHTHRNNYAWLSIFHHALCTWNTFRLKSCQYCTPSWLWIILFEPGGNYSWKTVIRSSFVHSYGFKCAFINAQFSTNELPPCTIIPRQINYFLCILNTKESCKPYTRMFAFII